MADTDTDADTTWPTRLLIIGCGNMGGAMLAGWLRAGIDPRRFTVVDPRLAEAPAGVALLREIPRDATFDAMLLGFKPQQFAATAPAIAPLTGGNCLVLSILAGVELASLAARLPHAGGYVRIMPNLAAALGKSPMGLAADGLDTAARVRVTALLSPLGAPEWLADEASLHAVTALAGSGPGFVYRFIEALADAGVAIGLPRAQADRMALAMVEGAALLAGASQHSPGELARRVASPGGVTQAGLDVLDDDEALARLVSATLVAARNRSQEMAEAAR